MNWMRNSFRGIALLLAFCAAAAAAQLPPLPIAAGDAQSAPTGNAPAQVPAFDVVSVKPHKDEGMMMRMAWMITQDGVSIDGVQLGSLLLGAFDVPKDRILNEPDWVGSSRFDIEAKVTPEDAPKLKALTRQQRSAMLLPILEDRFGLKFHHETRELEVYALVLAKGGSKLKESAPEDSGEKATPATPPPNAAKPGTPPVLKSGQMMMSMSPRGSTIQSRGATIAGIVEMLSQQIGSTVVDNTGLKGKYDYTLSFAPVDAAAPPEGGGQSQEPVGPSIFTALQEQLGLKLQAQKQAVDVIVIDHIEQPSAN
jgi:uncharacterized protein (TIGR03435 family)